MISAVSVNANDFAKNSVSIEKLQDFSNKFLLRRGGVEGSITVDVMLAVHFRRENPRQHESKNVDLRQRETKNVDLRPYRVIDRQCLQNPVTVIEQ